MGAPYYGVWHRYTTARRAPALPGARTAPRLAANFERSFCTLIDAADAAIARLSQLLVYSWLVLVLLRFAGARAELSHFNAVAYSTSAVRSTSKHIHVHPFSHSFCRYCARERVFDV
eukprot:6178182-Pleurochrysis_carterae.AAC.4